MIDIYKNVIRYQIKHRLHYVNNTTPLQMKWISLIDDKLD